MTTRTYAEHSAIFHRWGNCENCDVFCRVSEWGECPECYDTVDALDCNGCGRGAWIDGSGFCTDCQ